MRLRQASIINHVVFIICKDIEKEFKEVIGVILSLHSVRTGRFSCPNFKNMLYYE